MCYFVSSRHNCSHLHEKFARCFFAQRDGSYACNQESFPIWQHPDPFPCPECRADRKAETQDLMTNKGRKVSETTKLKAEIIQQDNSNARFSRESTMQYIPSQLNQQIGSEYANIGVQLQTLADKALHTSPTTEQLAEQPWVPPSRRHGSIVGQLGSSPPPQLHAHGNMPSQSPEMISVDDSSRPDSVTAPVYSDQVQPASPSLAWLLR